MVAGLARIKDVIVGASIIKIGLWDNCSNSPKPDILYL